MFIVLSRRAAPTNTAVGRVKTATMSAHPSLVEWKKLRFVIMDAPKDNNLHLYIKELKKQNVVCVVRVCEPTYPAEEVEAAGIKVGAWENRGALDDVPRREQPTVFRARVAIFSAVVLRRRCSPSLLIDACSHSSLPLPGLTSCAAAGNGV